jgi:cytochrome c peroxidase
MIALYFRSVVLAQLSLCVLSASLAHAQRFPSVPFPSENQLTEEKRVLGKILFWEEQLSSDGSVACGTCHAPSAEGSDCRSPSGR